MKAVLKRLAESEAARRSVLRATNSGISALVGPDGVVREVVTDAAGRRKMIAGALRARVPVPTPDGAAATTFFVRTQPLQPLGWGGGSLLLLLVALVRRRFGQSEVGQQGAACDAIGAAACDAQGREGGESAARGPGGPE